MRRRTLIHWGVAATAGAGLVGLNVRGKIGASEIAGLQQATTRLVRLDQQHGGETLWRAAAGHVNEAYLMLEHGTYTEAIEQQLLRATGRLQKFTGWLAFDAGQQAIARSCYTDALALARQSDDAENEAFALAQLSHQSYNLGQPREGLRFAGAAEQAATSLRKLTIFAVIPHLRQAASYAHLGDTRDSDRAITQARRILDRHGHKPTDESLAFIGQSEIDSIEAYCALHVGRASQAEALLEQAIAGEADRFVRNRALDRAQLARARLDRKAVDGAVEAAHAALDDLAGDVASWRVNSRLDAIAQRLADYPGVADVDSFLDRHQALSSQRSRPSQHDTTEM